MGHASSQCKFCRARSTRLPSVGQIVYRLLKGSGGQTSLIAGSERHQLFAGDQASEPGSGLAPWPYVAVSRRKRERSETDEKWQAAHEFEN